MFWVQGVPIYGLTTDTGNALPVQRVTWDAGMLVGNAELVGHIRANALAREGDRVGPIEGPYTDSDHLQSALSALFIIVDAFIPDSVAVGGDVPVRPSIPAGAIG